MNTQVQKSSNDNNSGREAIRPPVDVVEDANGITLFADFPGVPKEKLNIHVEGDTLILEGELGLVMPEGMEAVHADVDLPNFKRVFTLSKDLDTSKISADFQQGVLKLRIPKAEHAQPRKIAIQS